MKTILKLPRPEILKIYKKIFSLIKTSEVGFFKLKKLKGAMGYCEWEQGITLDYRRELFATLIHECIHYLYPDWSETQVLYAERRVVNTITSKQVAKLLLIFIEKL